VASVKSGGTEELDSFMITSLLAPPGVREMAAGDTFRKLGITPLLRMAAHVHRSVGGRSVKFSPLAGTLFVGMDTGIRTGLPVMLNAPLFLHELSQSVLLDPRDDADVRELFPRIREMDAGRRGSNSPAKERAVSLWDWNRQVLTAGVSELVPRLLGELKHPLEFLYARDARLLYRYWPRFDGVGAKFKMFVTPSLYAQLAKAELYLTKSSGFCSIADGVFEDKA
jgi:hypothetical protein